MSPIMEFLFEYGLFLAKSVTIVIAIVVVVALIVGLSHKGDKSKTGQLHLTNISEELNDDIHELKRSLLNKDDLKQFDKEYKQQQKKQQKHEANKLFILSFKGDMQASAVESLREEVTAVISIAQKGDEVLLNLESPGGVVHGYGLAASQLTRLKTAGLKLTVAVDKVAASGGYMMACVADKIISAPFAVIGSIGVIAQLPNINKLLKKHDIDVEMHTAGEFKRTLTVIGENTEEGREKFKQELAETHDLFKDFVKQNRDAVEINDVATGEVWYGSQALDKNLVDEILTSDDFILNNREKFELFQVSFKVKQKLAEKIGVSASVAFTKLVDKLALMPITHGK